MNVEELDSLLTDIEWFQHLGEPDVDDEFVRLPNLKPWTNEGTSGPELERLADQMDWLPSSRDQDDPIHGNTLEQRAETLGKKQEFSKRSLETYKAVLTALRQFDGHPALKVGPHDFTEAARGAALFAARRAAYEALMGEPGFWCRLVNVYRSGYWPCGILPDQRVVVL